MSCCSSITDLGCFGFCDTIETGVTAPATDTYLIEDTTRAAHFEVSGTIGTEITFTNVFNEDSVTVFKIKRGASYIGNCYQVNIRPSVDLL